MTKEMIRQIENDYWEEKADPIDMAEVFDLAELAIKALEQQPSEDCISREEALRHRHIIYDDDGVGYSVVRVDGIEQLPSVIPQQTRWIPVSERFPKENEYIGNVCKYYLVQDEYGDMHVAHLSNVGWIPMDSLKAIGDEVIAWMPLPQPYKAESEDKE